MKKIFIYLFLYLFLFSIQNIYAKNVIKYKPKDKQELYALINDESIKLSSIDTSLITDMSELFEDSQREDFSGIGSWNVSNVENMRSMFSGVKNFNEDISRWNV